jgi:hypothetical protein
MIFEAEIGLQVDDKRQIWISGKAITEDGEDPADLAPAVIPALVEKVTQEGLAAYERTEARRVISGPVAGASASSGDPTRPRPEHPETMRAFGEDD